MQEMIKRRKDEGFTLIELMIVIAVIGILAIVLVPKMGTVKAQAKSAGIDVNIRMVEGYVQSKSSYWASKGSTTAIIAGDIYKAFNNSSDKMANPFSSGTNIFDMVEPTGTDVVSNALVIMNSGNVLPTATAGIIMVSIPNGNFTGTSTIQIDGYDNASTPVVIKTVTITP